MYYLIYYQYPRSNSFCSFIAFKTSLYVSYEITSVPIKTRFVSDLYSNINSITCLYDIFTSQFSTTKGLRFTTAEHSQLLFSNLLSKGVLSINVINSISPFIIFASKAMVIAIKIINISFCVCLLSLNTF
eukprot:NODE_265_length_11346_cov_0.635814.p10 type:complete len:130 gc:universal NODE_265_length_11346_cov_0.635814:8361-7972(-)